jgi:hypothetical protein
MSAIIVSIDSSMPSVLNGELKDKQSEQQAKEDNWLFEPTGDCAGLTLNDYRQRLALHRQLVRILQSGSFNVSNNLKMMARLIDLHQRMRAMRDVNGTA